VGRTQRALTSLVAAIPAGFLGYLLVMVFLNQADSLSMNLKIVAGATLFAAAIIVLMPFILLLPGKKKDLAATNRADEDGMGAIDVVEDMDTDDVEADSSEVDLEDAPETSDFDIGDSDDDVLADSSADFNTQDDSGLSDSDFDMDDDEPPAKKRKK
jgi:hypothetical protein